MKNKELFKKIKKKVDALIKDGSTKSYAIDAVCRDVGYNHPYKIYKELFPKDSKPNKIECDDIKTSEGSYVKLKKNPNKVYEVININNKSVIILRDLDDNSEIKVNEDEILPVVMETMMKKNLNETNYNLSIDGLETVDADTLSQILTLAGQAENNETSDVVTEPVDTEMDFVQSEFDSPMTMPTEPTMDGEPSMSDETSIEATDAEITPSFDEYEDVGYGFDDMMTTESVDVKEDVLLDPQSDDETYNAERKESHEKEELEEAYNGNYDTLKSAILHNEVSDEEAISALLDMGEATDEEEAKDIISSIKADNEMIDDIEETNVVEDNVETYNVYEFNGDECLGTRNASSWEEAEKIAKEIYNGGSDAIIAGVDVNGEEIDLGEKGEFIKANEEIVESDMDMGDIDMSDIEDIDMSESEEIVDGEEIIEEETNNVSNKSLKNKLINIVSSNGFDDSESCYYMFDCMSPKSKQEFLTKYDYEDIGYAYDADRGLAYKLIDNMNDEELLKCQELLNRYMNSGEEIIEEETKFDDEIAECLRLAGVELNEVSDKDALKGKKDIPQVVGHKTAFTKAKQNGFKPGENQRPNYKCVKTKDVMGKKASEGTARPMNIAEMVNKSKIESICETASKMYAKKDHKEWLALDRRYVEKLIKEGVSYSNASKMLLKAKKGN